MRDFLRYHWARIQNRRALRVERRRRADGNFTDAANKAEASNYTKGGYFTK